MYELIKVNIILIIFLINITKYISQTTKIDIDRHMLNIQKKMNCIFTSQKKNHHIIMPCSLCKVSGHNKTTCSRRFFYVTEYEEEICALMNANIVIPCSFCKVSGHVKTTCPDRFFYEEISALMNINVNVVIKTIWRCSSCYGSVNDCTCPRYLLATFDVKTEEERQCPYCRDPYCTWYY